ncbi:MAG: HAMP domain-containing protein [Elusimicrobia bacterium]|nr:HAMP domain-containing protein [Elusimicrobiota bacterium]
MTNNAQQKPAQFQRKTILVKKRLQYRYMALIMTSVLLAFLIVGLDLVWTISKVINDHPMMQPLLEEMLCMAPLFVIKLVVYLIIVLIVSAVVSHRMAGPIFKFEKSCATVASGDLTHRVYLRKGDQLTELQEHFNDMVGAVHASFKEVENFKRAAAAKDPGLKTEAETLTRKILGILPNYKI